MPHALNVCDLVLIEIRYAKESPEEFVKTQGFWSPRPREVLIGRFGVGLRIDILERPQVMLLKVHHILNSNGIISS